MRSKESSFVYYSFLQKGFKLQAIAIQQDQFLRVKYKFLYMKMKLELIRESMVNQSEIICCCLYINERIVRCQNWLWFSRIMTRDRFSCLLKFFYVNNNDNMPKKVDPGYVLSIKHSQRWTYKFKLSNIIYEDKRT